MNVKTKMRTVYLIGMAILVTTAVSIVVYHYDFLQKAKIHPKIEQNVVFISILQDTYRVETKLVTYKGRKLYTIEAIASVVAKEARVDSILNDQFQKILPYRILLEEKLNQRNVKTPPNPTGGTQ